MNVNKLKKTLSMLLIAAFMLSAAGCSMIDYKKAEKLKNDGDYAAAQEMYIALGDYKDSAELADECGYQLAKTAYDSEDYETAAGLFDKLGTYKNSAELKQKCDDQILSAKLVGKWVSGNVDVTELVQTTFAALSGDADVGAWYNNCNFDDCAIVLKIEFTDSGTFIYSFDAEAFADPLIADLKEGFQITMEDSLRQSIADNGLTMEDVEAYYGTSDIDEIFAIESGITIGDYFDTLVSRDTLVSMYGAMNFTGAYSVENGSISFSFGTESEEIYYDSGSDTITMTDESLANGDVTFTREKA